MPGWSNPDTMIQLPCEVDVSADISPSRIRAAQCQIHFPKGVKVKVLARQEDIDRWVKEGVVCRSIEIIGHAGDGVAIAKRGPVTMAGYEMIPTPELSLGKLVFTQVVPDGVATQGPK